MACRRAMAVVVAAVLGCAVVSSAQTCVENTLCDLGPAGPGRCTNGVCVEKCCNLDEVCGAPCTCQGQQGSQTCFQAVCRCCAGGPTCPFVCDFGPLECACVDKYVDTPCGNPPNQVCCAIGSVCA